jgi:hypothetical protein
MYTQGQEHHFAHRCAVDAAQEPAGIIAADPTPAAQGVSENAAGEEADCAASKSAPHQQRDVDSFLAPTRLDRT